MMSLQNKTNWFEEENARNTCTLQTSAKHKTIAATLKIVSRTPQNCLISKHCQLSLTLPSNPNVISFSCVIFILQEVKMGSNNMIKLQELLFKNAAKLHCMTKNLSSHVPYNYKCSNRLQNGLIYKGRVQWGH